MIRRGRGWILAALASATLLSGCDALGDPAPRADQQGRAATEGTPAEPAPAWGPTAEELKDARTQVSGWRADQLAGQVIVGRYHSVDPQEAASLVADLHLAGVSVTAENVVDEEQVRGTTAAVQQAVTSSGRDIPAVIGVDEEGGSVAHLRGIATTYPSFATSGRLVEADPVRGRQLVRRAMTASGLELRDFGFTWVFAPVADVTIGAADPTIGSRSPSTDPAVAGKTAAAAVRGYNDAGIVSTTKHFPGHGSATADSHLVLPALDATMTELEERDLVPFRRAIRAGAPAIMMSHLDVRALEPGVPATLSPSVHDYLRDELGFDGVIITDSLGMGAVTSQTTPAVRALLAGADLLLMPADTRRTHATLTAAIESGEVPRDRIEEAAARVVALQRWQARTAAAQPVPSDVGDRSAEAAALLMNGG